MFRPRFQPNPDPPAPTLLERLRAEGGRRALGLGLALLLEALLILLLFSLGAGWSPDQAEQVTVVNLEASDAAQDDAEAQEPEAETPDPAQPADERPTPQPVEQPPAPQPIDPAPAPIARAVIPTPYRLPPPAERAPAPRPPADAPVYGPPDTGGGAMGDTERVGTAPNGQPLYAASWYREPRDGELRGYLSTASGPGWGLIACRTAPNYRVEDCVALEEYPRGSQINRAILAAAWQFQVRPPRLGGQPQVGTWVRIRIDYGIDRL